MVTEGIFNFLFGALEMMMTFFPFFNIEIDFDTIQVFFDIVKSISYLLPMDTIVDLIQITIAVMGFRIVISSIKTIWNLIPLL